MYKGYIYRHWIILEDGVEKSYIGQTIRKPSKRWKNGNGYTGYDSDTHFARAINKYGWDKFNHEIIGIVESETKEQVTLDLNEWEVYYIEKYDSFYNGYNETLGGYALSGESNPNSKRVICLNTRQVFNTCLEAKEWCGTSVSGYLNNGKSSKHCGKHPETGERLAWMFLDDYEKSTEEEINNKLNRALNGRHGKASHSARKVVCLNSKMVFNTINDAKKYYNLKSSPCICSCCRGNRLYYGEDEKTHEKLYWMYYEEYIKLENIEEELQRRMHNTLENEQRMYGSKNPSAKKIICLNDKNIFGTVKEASIHYNAPRGAISGCLTGKRKSAGKHPVSGEKLHWMYYEDWLKLQENN